MNKQTWDIVLERLQKIQDGSANVLDIDVDVACYIAMVSAKILKPENTLSDATQKWAGNFDHSCFECPALDRCALMMANK